jgi:hypothetical protein
MEIMATGVLEPFFFNFSFTLCGTPPSTGTHNKKKNKKNIKALSLSISQNFFSFSSLISILNFFFKKQNQLIQVV